MRVVQFGSAKQKIVVASAIGKWELAVAALEFRVKPM
ncbi:hypothetical protein L682_17685 [Aquipseudomonas alcaligenes OT 69]|nr:hypothetical protein L682_17685 [Pseudomonas alcaligenes OT 69]